MSISVQERASRYVAKMSPAISGSGGHDATFAVAVALVHGFSLSESEARAIMGEFNNRCSPPWSDRELEYKLRSAANSPSPRGHGYLLGDRQRGEVIAKKSEWKQLPKEVKVKFDPSALSRCAGGFRPRLDWFASRSYVDPALTSSEDFLSLLYVGEKVLIFSDARSQGQALWPDEPIPEPSERGMWFLGNPVDGLTHPNPRTGKESRRSEESIASWRYALLESDEADPSIWLGALAKSSLPIAAIYSSGGRSVHALIRVRGEGDDLSGPQSKEAWDRWARAHKPHLARLGADPKALTAVRLTRLPQQQRAEKGRLQKLLYVNPMPFGERIIDRAPRRDVLADAVESAQSAIWSDDVTTRRSAAARLNYYSRCNAKFPKMVEELIG